MDHTRLRITGAFTLIELANALLLDGHADSVNKDVTDPLLENRYWNPYR